MFETGTKIGFVIFVIALLLLGGTMAFSNLEGWSVVDSFYFTAMTLTTIGYGDFVPTHDISKLVTVVFALSGVAIFLYALSIISTSYLEQGLERGRQFEESEVKKIKGLARRVSSSFRRKPGLPR